MRWLFGKVLTCFVIAYLSVPGKCGEWHEYNDWMYYIHTETVTFDEANRNCSDLGANLTSIHSEEENKFLANFTISFETHLWIGLVLKGESSIPPSYEYEWLDGTPFDYEHWRDVAPSGGSCVIITKHTKYDNQWNDRNCDDLQGSVGFACKALPPDHSTILATTTLPITSMTTTDKYIPPGTPPGHSTHTTPVTTDQVISTTVKPVNRIAVIIGATLGILFFLALLVFIIVFTFWSRKRTYEFSTKNAQSQSTKIAHVEPYRVTTSKKLAPSQTPQSKAQENISEISKNCHDLHDNTVYPDHLQTSANENLDTERINDYDYATVSINNSVETLEEPESHNPRPMSVIYAMPIKPDNPKDDNEIAMESVSELTEDTRRLHDPEMNQTGSAPASDEGWEENVAYVGFEVDESGHGEISASDNDAYPAQQIPSKQSQNNDSEYTDISITNQNPAESMENTRPMSVVYAQPAIKPGTAEYENENPYELTDGTTPLNDQESNHVGGDPNSEEGWEENKI